MEHCIECKEEISGQVVILNSMCNKCLMTYQRNRSDAYNLCRKVINIMEIVSENLYTHDEASWRMEQIMEAIDDLETLKLYSRYSRNFL